MTPAEWIMTGGATALLLSLAALIPAIAGALKARADSRRARTESRRTEWKALREEAAEARRQAREAYDRLGELRSRVLEAETTRDSVAAEARQCKEEIQDVSARVKDLEGAMPFLLVLGGLDELEKAGRLGSLFDHAMDGWVVTSVASGGTFLFVNEAFCKLLNRSRDEILAAGWRRLVHPEDLDATVKAESLAWVGEVAPVNRFSVAGGGWRVLQWHAIEYRQGVSLALARDLGRAPDDAAASPGQSQHSQS